MIGLVGKQDVLTRKIASFGSWKSPITASMASRTLEFSEVNVDKETIYWSEMRPENLGRRTVVAYRQDERKVEDVTSNEFDVGTRVHEYGGGSYTVVDGELFFSNFNDLKIYRLKDYSEPKPITSNKPRFRYGDLAVSRRLNRLFCVREEHRPRQRRVVNSIVAISLDKPDQGTVIASGNDFYLSPKLSPDESKLAWVTWNFPNMPWDETELWTAEVSDDGSLGRRVKISSGAESILQPEWAADGALYFVSDRTGWWNIFRFHGGRIECMHHMNAEFGEPQWRLGLSTYALGAHHLICSYIRDGIYKLAIIDMKSKKLSTLKNPFTEISCLRACGDNVAFRASSPSTPTSIVRLNLATLEWSTLRKSNTVPLESSYLSLPEQIEFPTQRGRTGYAFYYAPRNKDFHPPRGEKPPLIVKVHGGPTHATTASFDLQTQFFTSRGFAVLDVNYGGSTGYGRKYRERLNHMWGVVDVKDCLNGAKFICGRGRADRKRLLIRGGSAGGFTTLASLAFTKSYRAGACYYGISDLRTWARDTHKFESHYLNKMIGPYPAERELYLKRSPARFTRRISVPLIIFQGLDDKVVPPSQSRIVVDGLRKRKLAVRYVEFRGEGHGFHIAEHIESALRSEITLYAETLGLRLEE